MTHPTHLKRIVCLIRRHDWREPTKPHRFTVPTRVCARCARVESKLFTGRWRRFQRAEGHVRV